MEIFLASICIEFHSIDSREREGLHAAVKRGRITVLMSGTFNTQGKGK